MGDEGPGGSRTGTSAASATGLLTALWDGGAASTPVSGTRSLTIGRDPTCDLFIEHASVSRKHATIHFNASGGAEIEDLGSRNGTRVGGKALAAGTRKAVTRGAAMEVGDAVLVLRHADYDDAPMSAAGAVMPRGSETRVPTPKHAPMPGETPEMERANRMIRLVSGSPITVILFGETGVGKEVFARRIHEGSTRGPFPFVALNCGALPEALLESELFGHEKGAFTGATAARVGLLESANRGTVFLDELGEMPAPTQVKLLRAIELREVVPVGASRPRSIDVRFIAATHRDLEQLVEEGTFRADLFFRLNGITIDLPPLRERVNEIAPLARTFAGATKISEGAIRDLEGYDWPGNIRELKNVVERAVLLAEGGAIDREHIMLRRAAKTAPKPRGESIAPGGHSRSEAPPAGAEGELTREEMLEQQKILDALQQCAGNQTKAAELLGITRRALIYRMEQFKIDGPRRAR